MNLSDAILRLATCVDHVAWAIFLLAVLNSLGTCAS